MKKSLPPPPPCGITGMGVFIGGPGGMGGCMGIGAAGAGEGPPIGGCIGIGGIPIGGCPPIIVGSIAGPERLMMIGRTGIVARVWLTGAD
jgi:hypothetical protein